MSRNKRHGFWNFLVVFTTLVCLLALLAHFKNWTRTNADSLQILSGFYYKKLKFSELDSVVWVDRIPPMERLNGFSVAAKEKGIFREFKDSLTNKQVHVYVDNLEHRKIKLVYRDSLELFLNLKDSLDSEKIYQFLFDKMKESKEGGRQQTTK